MLADHERRIGERRGPGPAEAHSLVAGHVDDQRAGQEGSAGPCRSGTSAARSVSCSTQLTMMSCAARNSGSGTRPSSTSEMAAARLVVVVVELHDLRGVDRRAHGGDLAVGEDVDVVDAVRVQRRDRAAGGRAEADHRGPQPAAVVAGRARSAGHAAPSSSRRARCSCGRHAVELTVGAPVVHRLERDQGEPPVDGQLGQRRVLHAVRPAPQRSGRRAAPATSASCGLASRMTSHSPTAAPGSAARRPGRRAASSETPNCSP